VAKLKNLLTVKEVADILKLHPRTVTKMARNGEIPAIRIGRVWRFDEAAVHGWLSERLADGGKRWAAAAGIANPSWNGTGRVAELISEQTALYVAESKSKREVLETLSSLAARTALVRDPEALLNSLIEREAMCPTAFDGGVAFPHPRHPLENLPRPVLGLLVTGKGVEFGAPDGEPTRVFVLVCSPDDTSHVKLLSHLARVFRPREAVPRLTRCRTPKDLLREVGYLEDSVPKNGHNG